MEICPVGADLFHADRHDEGNSKATDTHSNKGNGNAPQY